MEMADSEKENGNMRRRQTANEYAESVREWIVQYNMWQQSTMFNMTFPYYMMGCMSAQSMTPPATTRSQQPNISQNQTFPNQRRTPTLPQDRSTVHGTKYTNFVHIICIFSEEITVCYLMSQ